MATFNGLGKLRLDGAYIGSGALNNPAVAVAVSMDQAWASGTGSNQANHYAQFTGTAAAAAKTFDLAGGSDTDDFGTTLVFAKVRELFIKNTTLTTVFDFTVAGNFITSSVLGDASDIVTLQPGGIFHVRAPVDGYTVTGGTADTISLDPGANDVGYQMVIVGVTA